MTVELYENGIFIKSVKHLNSVDTFINNYNKKYKYKCIYESSGGDHGYYVLVNIKTQKCSIIAYKEFLGVYDKHGNKLYYGDYIKDASGNVADINEYYDKPGHYYYRVSIPNSWDTKKYDITDFTEYIKVKDIFETFTI